MFTIKIFISLCLFFWVTVTGQSYDKQDSGWVSLYNGKNFEGLYIVKGGKIKDPETQSVFSLANEQINVQGGGYMATKAVYKNYQVRVEYKFGISVDQRNSGLLYHISAADYKEGYAYEYSPPILRLYIEWPDSIPTVETAIQMLAAAASDNDPVEVKLTNGQYMEFENGLYDFDCGGVVRMTTPHANCPSCNCTTDIDAGGSSDQFFIRYYAMEKGLVEGTLFDMVLDRMGIQKG